MSSADERPIAIPAAFRGLSPSLPVLIYTRNLPHWTQEGASYFVTFRLYDSIPASVLREMRAELRRCYKDFRIAPGRSEPAAIEQEAEDALRRLQRKHSRLVEFVLDECQGSCVMRDAGIRRHLATTLDFHRSAKYNLFAYAIMPNHCHLLIKPFPHKPLHRILQSIKSFSARRINEQIGHGEIQLWQHESYDTIIRDDDHYQKAARYILKNPAKAKLHPGESDVFLWEE